MIRVLLTGFIRAYQLVVRPVVGPHCRYRPSCSDYAIEALRVHGAGRGLVLAGGRILRCHPWRPGGDDPVPCACHPPSFKAL